MRKLYAIYLNNNDKPSQVHWDKLVAEVRVANYQYVGTDVELVEFAELGVTEQGKLIEEALDQMVEWNQKSGQYDMSKKEMNRCDSCTKFDKQRNWCNEYEEEFEDITYECSEYEDNMKKEKSCDNCRMEDDYKFECKECYECIHSPRIKDNWCPKPRKWYDTASKENPVLCWVWDRDNKREVRLIIKFNKGITHPYETEFSSWRNAEPLTVEEIEKFIYKGDK